MLSTTKYGMAMFTSPASSMNFVWKSPNLLSAELDGHASHLAFLGELGLAASYDFSSHFSARAFVQAVWISGVALAPEQIAGTNFDAGTLAISGDGSLFYYGGGLGLEFGSSLDDYQ